MIKLFDKKKLEGTVKKLLLKYNKSFPEIKTTYSVKVLREDDDCIWIGVEPRKWPKRMFVFYEMLAKVESDVADEEGISVLLLPVRD